MKAPSSPAKNVSSNRNMITNTVDGVISFCGKCKILTIFVDSPSALSTAAAPVSKQKRGHFAGDFSVTDPSSMQKGTVLDRNESTLAQSFSKCCIAELQDALIAPIRSLLNVGLSFAPHDPCRSTLSAEDGAFGTAPSHVIRLSRSRVPWRKQGLWLVTYHNESGLVRRDNLPMCEEAVYEESSLCQQRDVPRQAASHANPTSATVPPVRRPKLRRHQVVVCSRLRHASHCSAAVCFLHEAMSLSNPSLLLPSACAFNSLAVHSHQPDPHHINHDRPNFRHRNDTISPPPEFQRPQRSRYAQPATPQPTRRTLLRPLPSTRTRHSTNSINSHHKAFQNTNLLSLGHESVTLSQRLHHLRIRPPLLPDNDVSRALRRREARRMQTLPAMRLGRRSVWICAWERREAGERKDEGVWQEIAV